MYTIDHVLRVSPSAVYTLPKVNIVIRKPKKSTWDTLNRKVEPLIKINVKKVRNRFARFDWLNPSQFSGKDASSFCADSPSGVGFFAVTLTIDFNKCKWAESGTVDFCKMFRSHDQNLGRGKFRPAYAWQVDLDQGNKPHIHEVFLCRNEGEAAALRKHLAWWEKSHGFVDVQPLTSTVDVAKWVNYMFKARAWHDSLPERVFSKVDIYRDLGKVSAIGVPSIQQMSLDVISSDEKAAAPALPAEVMCSDGYSHRLDLSRLKDVGDPGWSKDMVHGPWLNKLRSTVASMTPMQLYSSVLYFAHKSLYQAGALALVRLAHPAVISAFFKVWTEGGRQRAVSYLIGRLGAESSDFAWRAIVALRESGIHCGVRLITSAGERIHKELDSTSLFGMQTRSPEEITEMVDRRFKEAV